MFGLASAISSNNAGLLTEIAAKVAHRLVRLREMAQAKKARNISGALIRVDRVRRFVAVFSRDACSSVPARCLLCEKVALGSVGARRIGALAYLSGSGMNS